MKLRSWIMWTILTLACDLHTTRCSELVFQTLYKFFPSPAEPFPFGTLAEADDGSFFGTTGGSVIGTNQGTIFRMTLQRTVTNVFAFDGTTGTGPQGIIRGSDNFFYVVCPYSGRLTSGPFDGRICFLDIFSGSVAWDTQLPGDKV